VGGTALPTVEKSVNFTIDEGAKRSKVTTKERDDKILEDDSLFYSDQDISPKLSLNKLDSPLKARNNFG
jgi:hypothetical protein